MKNSGDELNSDAVPVEGSSTERVQKGGNSKLIEFSKLLTKRSIAVVSIMALLLLGLYGLYDDFNSRNTVSRGEQTCNEIFIKKASEALQVNDRKALNQYRAEMLKDNSYTTNQNCLLILAKDSVATGDTEGAKKYIDALKKVYKPEVGYSKNFSGSTPTPEELEELIQLTNTYEESIQKQLRENNKVSQELDMKADENGPKQQ